MERKPKVLVTFPSGFPYCERDEVNFRQALPHGDFFFCHDGKIPEELLELIEIWIGNAPVPQLEKSTNLKWLQVFASGVDQYAQAANRLPPGMIVTNVTGAFGLTISEYMLGVLLMMMRNLHLYRDLQTKNIWQRLDRADSICGSRVLVVGLGDIGGEFAGRAKALGAYTVGIRRTPGIKPDYVDELYTMEALDNELSKADVVALSLPGTTETRGLFHADRLKKIKKGAYIVNVGRGNAIECDSLTGLLRDGSLKGVALDVTDPEPLPAGHPLWNEPNAVITPHCSGNYTLGETVNRIRGIILENLALYGAGKPLKNMVDLSAGYRVKK